MNSARQNASDNNLNTIESVLNTTKRKKSVETSERYLISKKPSKMLDVPSGL
jgi:hypothetical protein